VSEKTFRPSERVRGRCQRQLPQTPATNRSSHEIGSRHRHGRFGHGGPRARGPGWRARRATTRCTCSARAARRDPRDASPVLRAGGGVNGDLARRRRVIGGTAAGSLCKPSSARPTGTTTIRGPVVSRSGVRSDGEASRGAERSFERPAQLRHLVSNGIAPPVGFFAHAGAALRSMASGAATISTKLAGLQSSDVARVRTLGLRVSRALPPSLRNRHLQPASVW